VSCQRGTRTGMARRRASVDADAASPLMSSPGSRPSIFRYYRSIGAAKRSLWVIGGYVADFVLVQTQRAAQASKRRTMVIGR